MKLTAQGSIERERHESVMEGHNGFLIQPRNLDALVAAMQRVLSEPARITALGHASRQLAEDVFDVRLVNAIILRAMQLTDHSANTESPILSVPVPA